jgi:hypothetical protein
MKNSRTPPLADACACCSHSSSTTLITIFSLTRDPPLDRMLSSTPRSSSAAYRITSRIQSLFKKSPRPIVEPEPRHPSGLPLPPRDGANVHRRLGVTSGVLLEPPLPVPAKKARYFSLPVPPPSPWRTDGAAPALFDSTFPPASHFEPSTSRTEAQRVQDEWRAKQRAAQASLGVSPRRASLPPYIGVRRVPLPRVPADLLELENEVVSKFPSLVVPPPVASPMSACIEECEDEPEDMLTPRPIPIKDPLLAAQPPFSSRPRGASDASAHPSLVSCRSSLSQETLRRSVTPERSSTDLDAVQRIHVVGHGFEDESLGLPAVAQAPPPPKIAKPQVPSSVAPPPRPPRSVKRVQRQE